MFRAPGRSSNLERIKKLIALLDSFDNLICLAGPLVDLQKRLKKMKKIQQKIETFCVLSF